ncbi:MAG: hypothetical protein ABR508_04640 [Candidatus Baltobacteraceae bacterium]
MIVLQRVMALLMAAAMVFLFLLPRALAARNYALIALLAVLFLLYVAVNVWLLRTRLPRIRS